MKKNAKRIMHGLTPFSGRIKGDAMKKRCLFFLAVAFVTIPTGMLIAAKDTQLSIPPIRLRIIYEKTGQPVEWVMVTLDCYQKLKRSERPSDQPGLEEERTCHNAYFLKADDGWITTHPVTGIRINHFKMNLIPAACGIGIDPFPGQHIGSGDTFCEKTLPKFLSLPESKRVLTATLANSYYQPSFTNWPNYNEALYWIATWQITLATWPELDSLKWLSIKPPDPEDKQGYWGAMGRFLQDMQIILYPNGKFGGPAEPIMTETERQDVLKHVQLVVCQEIKEKLQKWPDQAITRNIREHQIFQKMGGCPDLLPQNSAPTVTTVPELQSQATPTPPSQNNQPGEKGAGE